MGIGRGVPEERPYVLNIKNLFKSTEIKDNTCYNVLYDNECRTQDECSTAEKSTTGSLFITNPQSVNSKSDYWNDNLQSFNREKNQASAPVFYADWTSVPVPRTSSLRGLNVGFIPPLPKELLYLANNGE